MAKMELQILSDLHLETPTAYDVFEINVACPNLALLGDIGYVRDKGLFEFLKRQLRKFKIVFLLLGNHEPYHSRWNDAKTMVHNFSAEIERESVKDTTLGKFVFLDQTRYDVSDSTTILGCTLYSNISAEQSDHVSFGLNDFYQIEDWSVQMHQDAHAADLKWLNDQVKLISSSEPTRKIIILSHHSPSIANEAIDPKHRGSRISSGFMTDLSAELCWKSSSVVLWAFGHTHFNCDFRDESGEKRVLTNQRGYYFSQADGFDPQKVVVI